jgi:hypothetical protein
MLSFLNSRALLALTIGQIAFLLPAKESNLPVTEVALYKNGWAVIRHSGTLTDHHPTLIRPVGNPVHGTIWFESDHQVQFHTAKVPGKPRSFQWRDLDQQQVTLRYHEEQLSGTLHFGAVSESAPVANRHQHNGWGWHWNQPNITVEAPNSWALLADDQGQTRPINVHQATILSTPDLNPAEIRHQDNVLAIQTHKAGAAELTYLTFGLSWAPSYRLKLNEGGDSQLEQQAIIRNDLVDLGSPRIYVTTGFPQISLAHVQAPLGPQQNWNAFIQQITHSSRRSTRDESMLSNQSFFAAIGSGGGNNGPQAQTEARQDEQRGDLFRQDLGHLQLNSASALQLQTLDSTIEAEPTVSWEIVDPIDDQHDYYRRHNQPAPKNEAWNSLRFQNPFDQPLTTAPIIIEDNRQFIAQTTLQYTPVGESQSVNTTKALSVLVNHSAVETEKSREYRRYGSHEYRQAKVTGTCTVTNTRKEPITLVATRTIRGHLLRSDREPTSELLATGVDRVNPHHKLSWEITIAPGETAIWTYQYRWLTRH